jgi:hypothetical protein
MELPKNVTDLVANKKTQTSVRTLQAQVLNFFSCGLRVSLLKLTLQICSQRKVLCNAKYMHFHFASTNGRFTPINLKIYTCTSKVSDIVFASSDVGQASLLNGQMSKMQPPMFLLQRSPGYFG